jgi:Zn-dependent M28 family amino/carboxypeptidase
MRLGVITLAALSLAAAAQAAPAPTDLIALKAKAAAIRDKALVSNTAYATIEGLTTEVGPRLAGSPSAKRATDWAVERLKALGFENVRTEPFPIAAWYRGAETAEVTAPFPQKLVVTALGRSVATPPGGLEAEAVVFPTYQALLDAPLGSLTGKIAVVTQPMIKLQSGEDYGALNPVRRAGPSEAAKRGAVAYLHRSLSTDDTRLPHTGAMAYQDGVAKIPAAALSTPDAELLDHMARRGKPIRIKLTLTPTEAPATAWNVIGELKGREKPDEMIVIGGHLDSWDLGTGAIDDAAGIGIVTAAAGLAAEGGHPRRTIRVMLFGSEEMAYSSGAFAAAHQAEAGKYVVGGEADFGADRVLALQLAPGSQNSPFEKALAEVLSPIKVRPSGEPALGAGDDFSTIKGVPFFRLRQDGTRYFDLHHSADDTLDKIDPVALNQAVAAWAAAVYMIADSDVDFRATMPQGK